MLTEEQRWKMVDACMGDPMPLVKFSADLWVYDRKWGIFRVPSGFHNAAMATLAAFHQGKLNYIELIQGWREGSQDVAERYLMETPGTCYKSSVSPTIIAGKREHLNSAERMAFRQYQIRYLEDGD